MVNWSDNVHLIVRKAPIRGQHSVANILEHKNKPIQLPTIDPREFPGSRLDKPHIGNRPQPQTLPAIDIGSPFHEIKISTAQRTPCIHIGNPSIENYGCGARSPTF